MICATASTSRRIARAGQPLPILPETKLEHGDVITFYGSPKDTKRAVDAAGYELPYSIKTDFIYMGVGIVLGLLIGLIVIDVGGIPLTLGSGGGCLLAGLLFGWMRGKHPMYGVMPSAASQLLKDFGLAAFVAVVGLNSGLQAVVTVKQSGMTIFLLGVFVTLFPLLLDHAVRPLCAASTTTRRSWPARCPAHAARTRHSVACSTRRKAPCRPCRSRSRMPSRTSR